MIGRHLVPYLMQSADVTSLDLVPVEAAAQSVVGSVTDPDAVKAAIEGVEAVVHMAYAHQNFEDLANQVDVNLKGAVNILEACVKHRIWRVVFASTVMTVWGRPEPPRGPAYHNFEPVNFYSYTKCCQELLTEMYTRQHDLSAICLRIGQPVLVPQDPTRFGPRFGMERDGEALLPVDDLCEAFRLATSECPDVKFASLFLVGDYGNNHYFVEETKRVLGLKYRWRVLPDPETEGAFVIRRSPAG
jgi:nucleoside-diphosphate-sugar epimerase